MPSSPIPSLAVRFLAALALAGFTAGCTPFQQAPEESPRLHVLQPGAAPPRAERRTDATVEVGTPRAAPGFDTQRIAYVERPY